jgi:hypothetical protein
MHRCSRKLGLVVSLGVLSSSLALASIATAQTEAEQTSAAPQLVRGLFGATPTTPTTAFADGFLAQLPYSQVRVIAKDFESRLGGVRTAAATGSDVLVTFEHGSVLATMHFDQAGKIDALRLHDEESPADEAALRRFLTAPKLAIEQFSPNQRSQVDVTALEALRTRFSAANGAFVRLDARPTGYVAVYARGELHASVATDADGLITAILFAPAAADAK